VVGVVWWEEPALAGARFEHPSLAGLLRWFGWRFLSHAAGLDVGSLLPADLERVVQIADEVERAAHALKAAAAARVAAAGTWSAGGDRTAAEWLARIVGSATNMCSIVGSRWAEVQRSDRGSPRTRGPLGQATRLTDRTPGAGLPR
jgi:hypothetical protein